MARKKESLPLQRVNILLYEGDLAKLGELYPALGASRVIRLLVHDHVRKIEEAKAQAVTILPTLDRDIIG